MSLHEILLVLYNPDPPSTLLHHLTFFSESNKQIIKGKHLKMPLYDNDNNGKPKECHSNLYLPTVIFLDRLQYSVTLV